MGNAAPYSEADRAVFVEELRQSASVGEATQRVSARLKRHVTRNSIQVAMANHGMGKPSEFLRLGSALDLTEQIQIARDRRGPVEPRAYVPSPTPQGLAPSPHGRTTVVISDMHAPYHDPQVWATKMAIVRRVRPDVVVIIGDFFDCYAVSRFPKDPTRKSRVVDEINDGVPLLDELESLNVPRVYFCEGNHEDRLSRYVVDMAPALHGMVRTLPELTRIAERGWHWVPYKRSVPIGKMRYSHDFTRCGVNAARQALLDVGKCITFGHTHRLGVAYQGTIEDGAHCSMMVGWGGDLDKVDYKHKNLAQRDFQHGCGIVDEDEDGLVWPQAVAILNGTAMVRGQKVTA